VESFGDQRFVQNYAEVLKLNFITQFDTEAFAKDYKLSTQVAHWLTLQLVLQASRDRNYDYILTGHHADDNVETFNKLK
jgi:tRNA(Ile)-lysidine synthase